MNSKQLYIFKNPTQNIAPNYMKLTINNISKYCIAFEDKGEHRISGGEG